MRKHRRQRTAGPSGRGRARGRAWRCPGCGKQFPRAGQGHSCVVVSQDDHFRDRPRARALFEAFRAAVEQAGGPLRLSVAKTRIGLITGITFSAVMPRQNHLRAHILLRRKVNSRRFLRIDRLDPYWVLVFEIRSEADLDAKLRELLGESWRLGTRPQPTDPPGGPVAKRAARR